MQHYLYRIDSPSGKYYVGRHSTYDIDDGYLGSGKWVRSIKDKSILTKTILESFPDFESLKAAEARLIAEVIGDPMNMNFNENPVGFSSELNHSKLPERRKQMSERIMGEKNPMFGKTHTDEYKKLVGEMASRIHKGRIHTEQARKNMAEGRKGCKYTEEGRRKLSESRKRTAADGSRMVPSFSGMTQSEEAKQILREKALARVKLKCAHCGSLTQKQVLAKWHSDGSCLARMRSNERQKSLSKEQVIEIKNRLDSGEVSSDLIREYGVSRSMMWRIQTGKFKESKRRPSLTADEVVEIKLKLDGGATGADLARQYGVTPTAISRIRLGKTYSDVPK